MNRARRRQLERKHRLRRDRHPGSKCGNPRCGICSPYARMGNSKQRLHKKDKQALDKAKDLGYGNI